MSNQDSRIYDALALPPEAVSNGGAEILRVGIVDNELYVTARRAFKDPARWGEVLADIARELALFHSAEDTSLTEPEILTQIEQAFAADLGAPEIDDEEAMPPPPAAKPAEKPAAKRAAAKPAKKAAKPAKAKAKAPARKAPAKARSKPAKRKKR